MDIVSIGIIILTILFSIKGFKDVNFFDRYKFNTAAILKGNQWDRMLASAFLHGDVIHLFFNMYSFFFFSTKLINDYGGIFFFVVYISSILAGNFLALFIHRNNSYYSAIGASGGVSGLIFAAVILDSTMSLQMMFIPIPIPGCIFGIIYLAYSIYGMKTQLGNIGHDAHLGGAFMGLLMGLIYVIMYKDSNYNINFELKYLLLMLVPLIYLIYLVIKEKK
ncbi:rhomboid family intramembrane serine protease [Apibacter muscae]|uniref:rhomboid family intramembrane serine protease n=1 Tax=Apibacter muscae TaxID=2509004 RepID=UPI0011AC10A6|nr:rhomboid family intramembrane serine protease [Apibacter muscae]TWP28874.1 rhomboid family intramembrane serine protease [Apibacter muscae]